MSNFSDVALFHSVTPDMSCVLLMDWSQFSPNKPRVVVEFRWNEHMRAVVNLNEQALLLEVDRMHGRGCLASRITIHKRLKFKTGNSLLFTEPVFTSARVIIPEMS